MVLEANELIFCATHELSTSSVKPKINKSKELQWFVALC